MNGDMSDRERRIRPHTMKLRCAWAGCTEDCEHGRPLPVGWVYLVTFHEDLGTPGVLHFAWDKTIRDAVLCREHAATLEGLLISL